MEWEGNVGCDLGAGEGQERGETGMERKITQVLLSSVGTVRIHRGSKIMADGVVAFLRALIRYKRKSCQTGPLAHSQ